MCQYVTRYVKRSVHVDDTRTHPSRQSVLETSKSQLTDSTGARALLRLDVSTALALLQCVLLTAVVPPSTQAATVSADARARFVGDYGMLVDLSAGGAAWVEDQVNSTDDYRARFYFKLPPQSCLDCSITLLEATSTSGGGHHLSMGVRNAGSTPGPMEAFLTAQHQLGSSTTTIPITLSGWHSAAISWEASASGRARLELDGSRSEGISGLALQGATIDVVRLGSLDDVPELSGPLYIDEFASGPVAFELIEDQLLAPPELLQPSGWSEQNPPTFAWTAVPGASSYELRVQNVDRGYEEVFTGEVAGQSLTLDLPLQWSERHVWAVRTRSVAGFGDLSPWMPFRLSCGVDCASVVFSDDFESGTVGRWSSALPGSPPSATP